VRQSIIGAARATRNEPLVQGGAYVTEPAVPIMFPGCQEYLTPEELWESGKYSLTRMQRSSSGATPSTYPHLQSWGVNVPFDLTEDIIELDDFWRFAELAGRTKGLGACRKQGFGRFSVVITDATSSPLPVPSQLKKPEVTS
jgi:hypothetical protein